jgi:addiction module HigA family antidote
MSNAYNPQTVTSPKDLLLELLAEHGMSSKEFALRTGKPEKTISNVLNGKSSITPKMAVQFEQVLKVPAHFWLEAQCRYDECNARNAYQKVIEAGIPWAKKFPYSIMAKNGWVPSTRKPKEKVEALLQYFGVASSEAWERCYFNSTTKVALRASLQEIKHAHALTAWLRHGLLQTQQIQAPTYNKRIFKKQLKAIQLLAHDHPLDFFAQLQKLCLEAGVVVVYSPIIKGVPIHGATRWNNGIPIIQLTGYYRRHDIFWFTFFHEAGHILEHGTKYISLENIAYKGEQEQYEKEADAIAVAYTFNKKLEDQFLTLGATDEDTIAAFAQQHNIHPAFILGRLQHRKIVRSYYSNRFYLNVNLEA